MMLKLGSRGNAVACLQKDLNALAHAGTIKLAADLETDGLFGEKTEAAVEKAQTALKVDIDGIAGNQTLGTLARKLAEKNAPIANKIAPAHQNKLIKRLLEIAQKEVGTREVGGNNCGARIRDYQRATDDRPLGPWPWCAAFASWCIREWVAQPAVRAALGWGTEGAVQDQRPKTSQAFGYIDWARFHNQTVLPETAKPEPGMIVIYDFSHIGIVKQAVGRDSFIAIEGNTNGRGDRDSTTGDGVWEKKRARSLVRNFIQWRFITKPPASALAAQHTLPAGVPPAIRGVGAIPRESLEFIIDEEGMDQPWRFPGGDSGVTIGHGYDLGAETEKELRRDWASWLSKEQLDRLREAIGKSGPPAAALCPRFEDIKITTEAADDVFYRCTVPKYYQQTLETFPQMDAYPGVVQGALLSLVFNRGTSLEGGRREEMRRIRDLLGSGSPKKETLEEVAAQLRNMKRIWAGKGLDGLVIRREKEARWVESAIA
ncbi:MAG: peptidoglycan-binding protein [Verrucomicrobiota bacterium]